MVLCPLGAVNQIFCRMRRERLYPAYNGQFLRPLLISNYTISTGSWHVQVGKKSENLVNQISV